MQLNTLKRKTLNRTEKRVGRGGKRGKTSGRGTKGQKARAGHKIWPNVREILKKIPKRRGYNFPGIGEKAIAVNCTTLEKFFSAGDIVTPALLHERGIVRSRKDKLPRIKILGEGELTKKLTISGMAVSMNAKEKIEKAGGVIETRA